MSVHRDIHVDRGADWHAGIDVVEDTAPVDLTGYSIAWYVTGLTPDRITGAVSVTGNHIALHLDDAVTAAMSRGVGSWELWLTNSGEVARLYSGAVIVE